MSGQTIVLSGVTSGIGLAMARALAPVAGRLVIVGRNEARLRDATGEVASFGHAGLDLIPVLADLASLAGSLSLAQRLEALPRIDVMIHNAGILPAHRKVTSDGFEESFAVNHVAPFVLNMLLRERLLASAPSRVVQVSAGLALRTAVDLEADPGGAKFEPLATYARTKLWNLLATLDFAASLDGTGVTANAVHPGVVRTRLGEGAPGVRGGDARHAWLSPEAGARGPLYVATARELERTTGRFFNQTEDMPIRLSATLGKAVVSRTLEALDDASATLANGRAGAPSAWAEAFARARLAPS